MDVDTTARYYVEVCKLMEQYILTIDECTTNISIPSRCYKLPKEKNKSKQVRIVQKFNESYDHIPQRHQCPDLCKAHCEGNKSCSSLQHHTRQPNENLTQITNCILIRSSTWTIVNKTATKSKNRPLVGLRLK